MVTISILRKLNEEFRHTHKRWCDDGESVLYYKMTLFKIFTISITSFSNEFIKLNTHTLKHLQKAQKGNVLGQF